MKRRFWAVFLSICLLVGMMPAKEAGAVTTTCTTYSGNNVEYQNYSRWSGTIKSYLTECTDGTIMRLQYGSSIGGLLAEYYDTSYNLLNTKIIAQELPVFGGFYETDTNYFLLTGQNNPDESADTEVYRITKYDKSWNRIASDGLYDCNTTVPFDAGSARMDTWGKYLLIRTCHEMYQSSDGYNHQANVTIQVDMDTMKITDSFTGVMNSGYGYVSHSFNQFIRVEDGHIIAVDHGDAYPRSIVLLKYKTDVSAGKFVPGYNSRCSVIDVLSFPGAVGENTTGASVGGFEISGSSYLVAGNSVVQDDNNLTRTTRNIFVAAVDKSTSAVTVNWLTNYDEGDGTTSTPQFVKISDNRFIILWSRNNVVYYTEVDGDGNQTGSIYSLDGNLSDCVPTVVNDKLVWYTWNNGTVTFYDISINDLSQSHITSIENGHRYENQGVTDGYASLVCTQCGDEKQVKVASSITVYWKEDMSSGPFSPAPSYERLIGSNLYFWIGDYSPSDADSEMEVSVSDPEIISYAPTFGGIGNMGTLTMLSKGTATVSIYPKYNPSAAKTYTFTVDDHYHEYEWTGTADGIATLSCTECGITKQVQAATSVTVWWNEEGGSGYYWSSFTNKKDVGDELYYMINASPSGADTQMEVIVADPDIISCTPSSARMGKLTALKTGKTTVTIRPKYNPEASRTYTVMVNGDLEAASFTADKESPQVMGSEITLKADAAGGTWSYTYKFYETDEDGNTTVIRDFASAGTCTWKPDTAGKRTLYVDIKDSDGTVVTKSMEYEASPFKITRASLALENDITVIFKSPAEFDSVYHDYYVEVVQEKENGEIETQKINGALSADGKFYEFPYTGVNAKEVVDSLDATIFAYDAQGNLVQGETKEDYSVKGYCMSMLERSDDELASIGMTPEKQYAFRTLLVDLLNYSSEAQKYFNYKADILANAELTDVQTAYASDDSAIEDLQSVANSKYEAADEALAEWKSVGLNLLSKTAIRVKFKYDGDVSHIILRADVEDGRQEEISEFEDLGNGYYYAYFDGFTAYQFEKSIDFTLMLGDKAISNTMRYSIESYAVKAMDSEALNSIVSAMMKYGRAAENYRNLLD